MACCTLPAPCSMQGRLREAYHHRQHVLPPRLLSFECCGGTWFDEDVAEARRHCCRRPPPLPIWHYSARKCMPWRQQSDSSHRLPEFSVRTELGLAAVSGAVQQKPLVRFTHITARP